MMRDYNSSSFNPGLKKTKRHIFRNLALFIIIAVLASVYFFHTEPEVIEQKEPAVAVTQLALPEIAATTPDIIPPAPVILDDIATNLPEPIDAPLEIQQTDTPLSETETATDTETAELPAADPEYQEAVPAEKETLPVMSATWETYTIKSGDSLANIFREWQLSPTTLHNIVTSSKLAKSLADIHPGETLKLQRDDDGDLLELVVVRSPTKSLVISKTETSYDSELVTRKVDIQHAFSSGTINTSLFIDGQNSGLTDAQIMEMAGIFGWDIDFALELRKGDSFKLMYEEHFLDGEKLSNGPILMAEFHNNKKTYRAVRYTTPDGDTSYYDPEDGRNKKRTFLRTPVKFARISSRFSGKRFHPKLKKWRAHRGVDYAAPTGTPVKAAGKGKVIFRGKKGGYGKVVIIQHGSKYTTLYAHLSKYARSSKKGSTVSQGQIIGYVGKTGLATGPHLHYEFRVNGVHRNPLTVKLPKADPINKKYRKDFDLASKELLVEFNLFDTGQQTVAQAGKKSNDG